MAIIVMNGILMGLIKELALSFATGDDERFKEAMRKLVAFEKENELIKSFNCKECGSQIFWEAELCEGCKEAMQ
jgi:hypothetical protein